MPPFCEYVCIYMAYFFSWGMKPGVGFIPHETAHETTHETGLRKQQNETAHETTHETGLLKQPMKPPMKPGALEKGTRGSQETGMKTCCLGRIEPRLFKGSATLDTRKHCFQTNLRPQMLGPVRNTDPLTPIPHPPNPPLLHKSSPKPETPHETPMKPP